MSKENRSFGLYVRGLGENPSFLGGGTIGPMEYSYRPEAEIMRDYFLTHIRAMPGQTIEIEVRNVTHADRLAWRESLDTRTCTFEALLSLAGAVRTIAYLNPNDDSDAERHYAQIHALLDQALSYARENLEGAGRYEKFHEEMTRPPWPYT